jgi:uncharacterized protein YggE
MNMKTLLAAAALMASTAPAFAEGSPVSLPRLAPGEVLLEVNAAGRVTSPATRALMTVSLNESGTSAAEARAELRRQVDRVTAAARAAGASSADIREVGVGAGHVMDGHRSGPGEERSYYANTQVEIRLRNAAAAPALYRTLHPELAGMPEPIVYEIDDDSAVRRQARDLALRNARADAESYAAAANLRIVRVLRVTERMGLDALSMTITESNTAFNTMRDWTGTGGRPEVHTFAILGVDYVLAPR